MLRAIPRLVLTPLLALVVVAGAAIALVGGAVVGAALWALDVVKAPA